MASSTEARRLLDRATRAVNRFDYATAVDCWEKAADLGNTQAMYFMGMDLWKRRSMAGKGKAWLERGAQLGSGDCCLELGNYYSARGNISKAAKSLGDGAKLGHAGCMVELGEMARAQGDEVTARSWWELANSRGDSRARQKLLLMELPGRLAELDLGKATSQRQLVRAAHRLSDVLASIDFNEDSDGRSGDSLADIVAGEVEELAGSMTALQEAVFLSVVLGIRWPDYNRGSGYWWVPQRIAMKVASFAAAAHPDEFTSAWRAVEHCDADLIPLALGHAANPNAKARTLSRILTICIDDLWSPADVYLFTAANPNSSKACASRAMSAASGQDAIYTFLWRVDPDYGTAFDAAIEYLAKDVQVVRSAQFWALLLRPDNAFIEELMEKDPEPDTKMWETDLQDLSLAIASSPQVARLALASPWPPFSDLAQKSLLRPGRKVPSLG